MSPAQLDHRYRQMMRHHPFGYALYKPILRSNMKPGDAGIFNSSNFWTKILDLNQAAAPLDAVSDASEQLVEQGLTWDPKLSRGAAKTEIGFDLTVPTGLPVDVGTKFKVATRENFGAVLVTAPHVHHHRVSQEYDIRPWFRRNKGKLLAPNAKYADQIREHGLFVVTGTFSTQRCCITSWADTSYEVYLGLRDSVAGVPLGEAYGGWLLGQSASGWNHYVAPSDDRYVVFVTGFWFKPRGSGPLMRISERTDSGMRYFDGGGQPLSDSSGPGSRGQFQVDSVGGSVETGKQKRPPSRWAIVIGINHYTNPHHPEPAISPLRGCVEDANIMESYFKDLLGLPENHIRKLTASSPPVEPRSKWPTKKNIIGTIHEVLRLADPNDLVYIHFSGHDTVLNNNQRYGLVPMDVKLHPNNIITAPEIKALLRQLVEKDLIVTVVLDCCHSSGIQFYELERGGVLVTEDKTKVEATVRSLDYAYKFDGAEQEAYRGGPGQELDEEDQDQEWNDVDEEGGRKMKSVQHWLEPSQGEYALLTACREQEKAYEMPLEGNQWGGVLTHCLVRILTNKDALQHGLSGLSYWRLHWHLAEAVQKQVGAGRVQNVLVTGATHRAFFGTSELEMVSAPYVKDIPQSPGEGTTIYLGSTECLGGLPGAKYDIYPFTTTPGHPSDRLAECQIQTIRNGNIEAKIVSIAAGKTKQITIGCPAVPQQVADEIRVRLTSTGADQDRRLEAAEDMRAIRRAWSASPSEYGTLVSDEVSGPTDLDLVVDEERREYRILDKIGSCISRLEFRADDDTAPVRIVKQLMHLVKFHCVLQMQTKPGAGSLIEFGVVGTISPSLDESYHKWSKYKPADKPANFLSYIDQNLVVADKGIEAHDGDIIALYIDNNWSEKVHFQLISLDKTDWSITPMHEPGIGFLEPGWRFLLPIENEASVPNGGPHSTGQESSEEIVKILASTSQKNFGVTLLPPLDEIGRGVEKPFREELLHLFQEVEEEEGHRKFRPAGKDNSTAHFSVGELRMYVKAEARDMGALSSTKIVLDDM